MKIFYTTFSVNKNIKLIFETNQPRMELSFDHCSAIKLIYNNTKIEVQKYSITAWSLDRLKESLQPLIENTIAVADPTINERLYLGFVPQKRELWLVIKEGKVFVQVIPLYPWWPSKPKRPYPKDYVTEKQFDKTVKPIISFEVPFKVIKRWYKKVSIIYEQTRKNYARDSDLSKEREHWPKKYSFTLKDDTIKIVFKTTAPFDKLYCYDKASLTLITPEDTYVIVRNIGVVECYERFNYLLKKFLKRKTPISSKLLPLGLIKEKIVHKNYAKEPSYHIEGEHYWLGNIYELWQDIKNKSDYNTWLYPTKKGLTLELSPLYQQDVSVSKTKGFNAFVRYYEPLVHHIISYETAEQWSKKLKELDDIIELHHKTICLANNKLE